MINLPKFNSYSKHLVLECTSSRLGKWHTKYLRDQLD